VNQIKTKVNHSKHAIKSNSSQKEEPGNNFSLSFNYKASRWIIDTGETDHVCHSLNDFQSIKRIRPLSVTMPNGEYVNATMAGTVIFSKDLYSTNVLFIPCFQFNLIAVS
jgi:hypothetical protein